MTNPLDKLAALVDTEGGSDERFKAMSILWSAMPELIAYARGGHHYDCDINVSGWCGELECQAGDLPCTCGYDALIAKLGQEIGE